MKASLKTRKDFLAAARAQKWVGAVMLVQQRDREDFDAAIRVGFTAGKKVGNAAQRSRAKRRLRALSAELLPDHGRPGHDYVWIAKRGAVIAPFGKLRRDGERALRALTGTKEPEAPAGAPKP